MSIEFVSGEAIILGNPTEFRFDPDTDEFTISCWFKCPANEQGTLLSKRDFTTGGYQMACIDFGGIVLFSNFGAVNHYGFELVDDDQWHHGVAVNRDVSGTLRSFLYVDGVDDSFDSPASGNGSGSDTYDVLINARRTSGNTGFGFTGDMEISDMRLYDRALTDSEVSRIYNSYGNDKVYDGLVGRWLLNDNAPGVTVSGVGSVKDMMNGKNDGTPESTPVFREDILRFGRGHV